MVYKLYSGYCLATINVYQTIPWVQFAYDLYSPNHTPGNVNIGYGLVVTQESLKNIHSHKMGRLYCIVFAILGKLYYDTIAFPQNLALQYEA